MQLLFQLLVCSLISHITPGSLSKLYRPHHNVTIIVMGVSQKCSFLPQFSIVLDVSPVDTAVPMLLSCISPVTVYSSIWNTHHECRRLSLTETIGFPHLLVYDLCISMLFYPMVPFFFANWWRLCVPVASGRQELRDHRCRDRRERREVGSGIAGGRLWGSNVAGKFPKWRFVAGKFNYICIYTLCIYYINVCVYIYIQIVDFPASHVRFHSHRKWQVKSSVSWQWLNQTRWWLQRCDRKN